jgi:hypothetical protein
MLEPVMSEQVALLGSNPSTQFESIRLTDGGSLKIASEGAQDTLTLLAADGQVRLVLSVSARNLQIQSSDTGAVLSLSGAITLEADSVRVVAKEHLALRSHGSLSVEAENELSLKAGSVVIAATRTDAVLRANDDVRIEAERIRMNS